MALQQKICEISKYLVLGSVDAGKSSLIGVLTNQNVLDDGNGYARSLILRTRHEKETGRTSTHNPFYIRKGNEVTTLVDLCGHEKYFKTTMFGITGLFCDYGLVLIGANMGPNHITVEHLGILIANRISFMIVITKIDLAPGNKLIELKKFLQRLARKNKRQLVFFEQNEEKVGDTYLKDQHNMIVNSFQNKETLFVPVIYVSNKTGHNIEFLKEMMTTIKSPHYFSNIRTNLQNKVLKTSTDGLPMIMYIDNTFNVKGIGFVLSGTIKNDMIKLGDNLFVGPVNGKYYPITVKTMHNCVSEDTNELTNHMSGSIGIRTKDYQRVHFRKGQIVTNNVEFAKKHTCYVFNCDIVVFNHTTTIRNGYQTMIHCGTIRQTAMFELPDNLVLRTDNTANLNVKFMFRPEFLLPGTYFMFRDGRTKGMGKIKSIVPIL